MAKSYRSMIFINQTVGSCNAKIIHVKFDSDVIPFVAAVNYYYIEIFLTESAQSKHAKEPMKDI